MHTLIVDLNYQSDWVRDHLGDTLLSLSLRVFLEKFWRRIKHMG